MNLIQKILAFIYGIKPIKHPQISIHLDVSDKKLDHKRSNDRIEEDIKNNISSSYYYYRDCI